MQYIHSINTLAAKPSHQSPCYSNPEDVPRRRRACSINCQLKDVCFLLKACETRGKTRRIEELSWDPENTQTKSFGIHRV